MTDPEYGPPIAVNGKRPGWLGDDDDIGFENWPGMWLHNKPGLFGWAEPTFARPACPISIKLRPDHPYYQSAQYKASVDKEPEGDNVPGYAGSVINDAVATLEAAGYKVTPPDPMAADREFLAGLFESLALRNRAKIIREGDDDTVVAAAMEYLRANKGRL